MAPRGIKTRLAALHRGARDHHAPKPEPKARHRIGLPVRGCQESAGPLAGDPTKRAASIWLILNPAAGAGRARKLWPGLAHEVERLGAPVRVVETREPGQATELARRAARAGAEIVVAAGGDGTAHEVVQGLMDAGAGPTLAYLPLGTGCDFAIALGLPRQPHGLLARLIEGPDRLIDVGVVEPLTDGGDTRYFLNAANIGLGPLVAARVRDSRWLRRWGTPAYLIAVALALLRLRPQRVAWRADSGHVGDEELINVSACNGPSFGGGMRPCPDAALDSGMLHVAVIGRLGVFGAFRQLPRLMRGDGLDHPAIRLFSCSRLRLDTGVADVEVDGELGTLLPAELRVRPAALRIKLPAGCASEEPGEAAEGPRRAGFYRPGRRSEADGAE